jgi:hypothetical protein
MNSEVNTKLIIESIEQNPDTLSVSVGGNISDVGTIRIAQAILKLRQLKSMWLKGWFTDLGANALATVFVVHKDLEHVVIEGEFGNLGLRSLLHSLCAHKKLEAVELIGSQDDSFRAKKMDIEAYIQSIKKIQKLTALRINGSFEDINIFNRLPQNIKSLMVNSQLLR